MLRRMVMALGARLAAEHQRPPAAASPCRCCSHTARSPAGAPVLVKFTDQKLEPAYLQPKEMMTPIYDLLNIQLKSYDFAVLENFQKWVHRTLRAVDIQVEDCWATPHTSARVTRLKPNSAVVDTAYDLNLYERNVQLSEIPTTSVPLVLDILRHSLPSGVWLCVQLHERAHDEIRYVPDLELKELKRELSEVGLDPDKRKRRAQLAAAAAADAAS